MSINFNQTQSYVRLLDDTGSDINNSNPLEITLPNSQNTNLKNIDDKLPSNLGQNNKTDSLSVVLSSDHEDVGISSSEITTIKDNTGNILTSAERFIPGEVWTAIDPGVDGTSASLDCQFNSNISVFGNASSATTITIQFSNDNTDFYNTGNTIEANGDFGLSLSGVGARYIRLHNSTSSTITAIISAKT